MAATLLLDFDLIAEIRRIGRATGRDDLHTVFVHKLETNLAGFRATFTELVARGDAAAAVRTAHTLKGTCRQLGAKALGELFSEIERAAKAGDFDAAMRSFDDGAAVIAQSLHALRQA
jgi:HPt (histidine-containing phosphotransfer) domain-containing protein